jgi:hypothetical protein
MSWLLVTLSAVLTAPAPAQANADRAAVERAALDYLEGFYNGDSTLIVRSIHPQVRKIGYFRKKGETTFSSEPMSFAEMNAYANDVKRSGKKTPATAPKQVVIYEVLDQTAAAKVIAWWGIDYLHLARYDGKWMIVNVMWQEPPRKG